MYCGIPVIEVNDERVTDLQKSLFKRIGSNEIAHSTWAQSRSDHVTPYISIGGACHAAYTYGTKGKIRELCVAINLGICDSKNKDFIEYLLSDDGVHKLLFKETPKDQWYWISRNDTPVILCFPNSVASSEALWQLIGNFLIMTRYGHEYPNQLNAWHELCFKYNMHPSYAYILSIHLSYEKEEFNRSVSIWDGQHKNLVDTSYQCPDLMLDVRRFVAGAPLTKPYNTNTSALWMMKMNKSFRHLNNFMFKSYARNEIQQVTSSFKVGARRGTTTVSKYDDDGIKKLIDAFIAYIDLRYSTGTHQNHGAGETNE